MDQKTVFGKVKTNSTICENRTKEVRDLAGQTVKVEHPKKDRWGVKVVVTPEKGKPVRLPIQHVELEPDKYDLLVDLAN